MIHIEIIGSSHVKTRDENILLQIIHSHLNYYWLVLFPPLSCSFANNSIQLFEFKIQHTARTRMIQNFPRTVLRNSRQKNLQLGKLLHHIHI